MRLLLQQSPHAHHSIVARPWTSTSMPRGDRWVGVKISLVAGGKQALDPRELAGPCDFQIARDLTSRTLPFLVNGCKPLVPACICLLYIQISLAITAGPDTGLGPHGASSVPLEPLSASQNPSNP
jgi:hypothetical protein